MSNHFSSLAYANTPPLVTGIMKSTADDFIVDEIAAFTPDNQGEHVVLHVEKKYSNTDWLAGQLARFADVPKKDVSYAGLKDRNALTRQWFSVRLAGKPEPNWASFSQENVRILQHTHHQRKIRRGALKGNRFNIVIRDLQGNLDTLDERIQHVRDKGVPNYFAEQRFGRNDANLEQAKSMFSGKRIKDRNKRSMYLSASRSFLFNLILSKRVQQQNWDQALVGDAMQLSGSNSFFCAEEINEDIIERINNHDIHPTGVLWGKGELVTKGEAKQLEESIIDSYPSYKAGLIKMGLEQSRRALRLMVDDLKWELDPVEKILKLSFSLVSGAYATSVLREIVTTRTP